MEPCSKCYCLLSPAILKAVITNTVNQTIQAFLQLKSMHVPCHPTFTVFSRRSCLIYHSSIPVLTCGCSFPLGNLHLSLLHLFHHCRQSLHSATWPRRKSLQGQRRLYLGECPAQLKRRGSRWRPHSRRTTEKAGRMWLISESTTSHCTSNLWGETEVKRSEYNLK